MIEYKSNGIVTLDTGTDQLSCHMSVEQKIFIKAIEQEYEDRLSSTYARGAKWARDVIRKQLRKISETI